MNIRRYLGKNSHEALATVRRALCSKLPANRFFELLTDKLPLVMRQTYNTAGSAQLAVI